jgi:hypothetical protein
MYTHITQAWDGVSSILATVLSVSFSLLSYKLFLDIRFVCLLASVVYSLCHFRCMQRPDQVLSFGLHLWEVCMSGILRRIQPHGYEAGLSIGFV